MKTLVHQNLFLNCLTLLLAMASSGHADSPGSGRFGAGFVIGSPTAFTGKYWLPGEKAVDFGLSFWSYGGMLIYGDYHWNFPRAFGGRSVFVSQLNSYVGVGAGISTWSERRNCGRWGCDTNVRETGSGILARIPFGVEWYPGNPPIGIFFEFVPAITVIPITSGYLDYGLGARFYF